VYNGLTLAHTDAPLATPTETIARVPHLLAHIAGQLPGLAAGATTFEDVRERYAATTASLAQRGLGRVTAPRSGVGRQYRYWSSVRDVIRELQTLGFVEPGIPVPSTKQTVDAHRGRRYPLTDRGQRAAEVVADRRKLADLLTGAAITRHPYLRGLLGELDRGPFFCPEVTESQIGQRLGTAHWARWATDLISRSDPLADVNAEDLGRHLAKALRRRFGRRSGGDTPTPKELQEATNDSLADATLQARGLNFGATTLDTLTSWGMELRLLDQSRYVLGHENGNLIWLASALSRDEAGQLVGATRRTFTEHGQRVAEAFVSAYRDLRAQAKPPEGAKSSARPAALPIHVVRAQAAFTTGTAREVADRALDALASGELDVGVRVRPLAARFETPPRSEPMYARGGTRALMVSITTNSSAKEEA